ncbi:MAG: type II toxin-antitoxin system Phd/YefM family antitoxin [Clostridia bacterium]|nr:type II toxin-antitoxin system Phd/YefM family antitoxin [Clostridia bacterium]
MTNVNITSFRKDIYKLLENTIKYNEPINISTKNGNAIILSEEDYNSLIETVYIESIPRLKKEILERAHDSEDEFVSEDEVEW